MSKKKIISFIALVLVVLFWGVVPVLGKYLFDNNFYSPALLVAVRGLIATVLMAIFIIITKQYKVLNKSYLICIPAGLILGSAYLFQFIGLETTTASKSTFLEAFSIVAAPITLLIIIKEKPTFATIISCIICLAGAFILCGDGWDFSVMFKVPSIGDIFSIIAGVLYGVNIAFTQVFAKDKNPIVYVSIQMAVLTLISFIYSFAFERPLLFSWDIKNVLIVFFLAIFCTAICWIVRTFAVKNISAITIGVMNPMSAVVATTIALSLGQEQFTYNLLVGALIIIAAILISAISQAVKEEKEKANSLGREE